MAKHKYDATGANIDDIKQMPDGEYRIVQVAAVQRGNEYWTELRWYRPTTKADQRRVREHRHAITSAT